MSNHIMKIIPADPYYRIAEQTKNDIVDFLASSVKADKIEVNIYDTPVFVDCGSNLESILCPLCGEAIDFDWWGDAMEAAQESEFMELSVKMPCCDGESTLNDLHYDFPCGFSCIEFCIQNPSNEPDHECLAKIQRLMGTPIRLIHAHL